MLSCGTVKCYGDAFELICFEFNFWFVYFFGEIMVRPWPYWLHRFLRPWTDARLGGIDRVASAGCPPNKNPGYASVHCQQYCADVLSH